MQKQRNDTQNNLNSVTNPVTGLVATSYDAKFLIVNRAVKRYLIRINWNIAQSKHLINNYINQ